MTCSTTILFADWCLLYSFSGLQLAFTLFPSWQVMMIFVEESSFPFLENQGQTCSIHLQSPTALCPYFSYCEISALSRVLDFDIVLINIIKLFDWDRWMAWKVLVSWISHHEITNRNDIYTWFTEIKLFSTNYTKEI